MGRGLSVVETSGTMWGSQIVKTRLSGVEAKSKIVGPGIVALWKGASVGLKQAAHCGAQKL